MKLLVVCKQLIRDLDARVFKGRLKVLWNRYAVLGGGWGEFLGRVDAQPSGSLVIDIGAGEAGLRDRVSDGVRYVAIDRGIGDGSWDYSSLEIVSDAASLPIKPEQADLVVCKQVLEHLPEPIAAIKEMARVLKPGGTLLLSTNQQWPQHQQPHDFFRFTSFGLRYCFEQAGLETQELQPMGGVFTTALFHGTQTLNPDIWTRGPKSRTVLQKFLVPVGWLLRLVTPLAALLDRLDKAKDNTLGYYAVAKKPTS